jgi:hypothetical protein
MVGKRARSGGKPSVRILDSDLETTQPSTARAGADVTLRQRPSGRLGQSVFVTPTEDPASDEYPDLPSLFELSDNEDDEELMDNFANALEEEFFPAAHQVPEKQQKRPVIYLLSFPDQMLTCYF